MAAKKTTKDTGRAEKYGANPPPSGVNHLLVIAIDEYAHCPQLNNCVKDARAFIAVLTRKYQFDPDHIVTLFNAEATRPAIHARLKALKQKINPKDRLVIYFSGHGETEESVGYWVPVEAHPDQEWEYFSTDEIKRRLDAINSFHTFVIVDACFSGALFYTYKSVTPGYETKRSRWGLAASHSRERALDGTLGENSPFAATLLRQLENSRNHLPVQELATAVIRRVEAATEGRQTPVFKPLNVKGDDSGQYVFHLRADEAADWQAAQQAGTLAAYQAFLSQYPDGNNAAEAQEQVAFLQEEKDWTTTRQQNTVSAYVQYRRDYPEGRHRDQALEAMQELEEDQAWRRTRQRDTVSAYEQFLERFPHARHRKQAEERMEALMRKKSKDQKNEEDRAWRQARSKNTLESYARYLSAFPKGRYAREAEECQKELEKLVKEARRESEIERAWAELENEGTVAELEVFRDRYPDHRYSEKADRLISQLKAKGSAQKQDAASPPHYSKTRSEASRKYLFYLFASFLVLCLSLWYFVFRPASPLETGMETLGGQSYRTVSFGNLIWMAENLNYNVEDSWCYDFNENNCEKHGRLYTWKAAVKACKAVGWRLPTAEEWDELIDNQDGLFNSEGSAYKNLIDGGVSNFAAQLGGHRSPQGDFYGFNSSGEFSSLGDEGNYWSAQKYSSEPAWSYVFDRNKGRLYISNDHKMAARSCRCVIGATPKDTY